MIRTVSLFGMDFTAWEPSSKVWSQDGGVCLFARLPSDSKEVTVFYVGACDDLHGEFTAHWLWVEAAKLGATHMLAASIPAAATRELIANNLVRLLKPVLNR